MISFDSRSEYEKRMHRVLTYIDQHLEESITVNLLAEVAHFSTFHFHRLFSAWMGETIGDYLRRRRVEVAAMRLAAQPRTRILNVALSVGFGSAEAFARAFKNRFGCSPTAWREEQYSLRSVNSNSGQVNSKHSQAFQLLVGKHSVSRDSNQEITMKVTLIDRQPATVAYFRHLGPYGEPIARFWQETYVPWAVMNKLGDDHARYGIAHDDPSITAPEKCRYDACAEVAPDFVAMGGALKTTIPGGKYALLKFKGTVEQAEESWTALLRNWLPSSGLQLDNRPCFEYYPKGAACDGEAGVFECEICIPVVSL
ncbi:MAG: AraC family transcriptional regulator [Candidatus Competibacteraceae bacterium]|nr:AraC family transcriptional regulator [Candidatus Competibacteraceae bacterium]